MLKDVTRLATGSVVAMRFCVPVELQAPDERGGFEIAAKALLLAPQSARG